MDIKDSLYLKYSIRHCFNYSEHKCYIPYLNASDSADQVTADVFSLRELRIKKYVI
jgi:hypothetical protein